MVRRVWVKEVWGRRHCLCPFRGEYAAKLLFKHTLTLKKYQKHIHCCCRSCDDDDHCFAPFYGDDDALWTASFHGFSDNVSQHCVHRTIAGHDRSKREPLHVLSVRKHEDQKQPHWLNTLKISKWTFHKTELCALREQPSNQIHVSYCGKSWIEGRER